jgi:hypothetical protein
VALYEGVSIPGALRRRLESVLRVEVAERHRHRAEATEFLGRRLRQLADEREKLLRAYYADAIDVATLKREQARTKRRAFASLLGSHKGPMVEVGGIEPPSPGDRSGLLRAQPVEDLASRLPPAERLSASPGEVSDGGPRAEPLP